ncbi:BamA/TamA family outer membrane protein [Flavobacterium luteum]|uniref:Outer membrane translocation and assembly module TamA n=1 Tax=Flavobacterium luteum TaxID=2026654 RepID=A0A7J5AFI2_9FLAO|nr:hypothetical protein [Flavobacterium luteum]KAB1155739.1 hypothetical protein F6464_09455 [Flavobacterium luteum]
MNKTAFIFLIFCLSIDASAQKLHLLIATKIEAEKKIIDSMGYKSKHENGKSIVDEVNQLSEKLTQNGYIENHVLETTKPNDSTFLWNFSLGKKTDFIHIYIGKTISLNLASLFDSKKDTLIIPFNEIETFLKKTLNTLERKGFALAKLKLINIKKTNDYLSADLQIALEKQRQLNDIVIRGYEAFPKGHLKNIKRANKNNTFNQENLKSIYTDFEKFRFVKQLKYPEILFEKDSTKIYVYLEKAKSNTFDGFIGFSNDNSNKVLLNGYLDLNLNNALNSGEQFSLFWKSDGNDQKTFNTSITLPYIFKSPFGLKAQLNIFRQDSTFQNTKTAIDLGYFFNYNTRTYIGYQSTESSDILNQNNSSISDFSNTFVTGNFEYSAFKNDYFMFPEKTKINIKIGIGSRNSSLNNNKQVFTAIDLKHNFYLNNKNSINIKSQNYYLESNKYIINELYRFGGVNSIRGFNENSLQGNLFTSILTEYRYTISPSLYIHSIIDYGYYKDQTSNTNENLLSLGMGLGILTKNGLINLIYANGSKKEQTIKSSNSIVHVSFKTNF